jgi:hypothetical protein
MERQRNPGSVRCIGGVAIKSHSVGVAPARVILSKKRWLADVAGKVVRKTHKLQTASLDRALGGTP